MTELEVLQDILEVLLQLRAIVLWIVGLFCCYFMVSRWGL
jgi:hypothetical protein